MSGPLSRSRRSTIRLRRHPSYHTGAVKAESPHHFRAIIKLKRNSRHETRQADVTVGKLWAMGRHLRAALNPAAHSNPVRELKDMTPEEIAALEARYGCKVG
jgi:hypothetical protein